MKRGGRVMFEPEFPPKPEYWNVCYDWRACEMLAREYEATSRFTSSEIRSLRLGKLLNVANRDANHKALVALTTVFAELDRLGDLIRPIIANPHVNIGDLVYKVREACGGSWTHADVLAFGDAVKALEHEYPRHPAPHQRAGIDTTKNCAALFGPSRVLAESKCDQPWTINDGVPYCDTCGLFKSSVKLNGG